jgi:hypothetical protein
MYGGDLDQEQLLVDDMDHGELQDQLHDLPFGGDVEIERWVQWIPAWWHLFGCMCADDSSTFVSLLLPRVQNMQAPCPYCTGRC